MMRALLVSPAPVDGYPPVQHQARLLADAGFHVVLITTPLAWSEGGVRFYYSGVTVHEVANFGSGPLMAARRTAAFVAAITKARRRSGAVAVEIAYEPLGLLYSDLSPGRPARRIAHFHECLQAFETAWIEKRVRKSIRGYQLVVVADAARAGLLKDQLNLPDLPTVVPNYPVSKRERPNPSRAKDRRFEVVYCGSVGTQQQLDLISRSVRLWPSHAIFHVVGNATSDTARQIAESARQAGVADRVIFDGWIAYENLLARLTSADLGISLLDPVYQQWRTALGASNKRYQYMQAGLPQIGDMNPGVAELLESQGVGRCISSLCESEVAKLVREYASDLERCRREGARAYALHLERYNYQSAFRPVLEWIASGVPRGDASRAQPHDTA
jgi:glycosyltransferase involved in cell wall biosynthesis